MSKYNILVLIFLLSSTSLKAGDPEFKILTYNIRYLNNNDGQDHWDSRKETVLATIQQADIAGLQEVVAEQYQFVTSKTPGWQWYGVGRTDGLLGGEMTPIGWRTDRFIAAEQGTFWLSEQAHQVGRAGWDAALPRIASWVKLIDKQSLASGLPSTLLVVNTHFDHRGQLARKNSAGQLRIWIAEHAGNSPTVMVGDLNAQLGSEPLNQLLDPTTVQVPALVDTRSLSTHSDAGPDSTWNGFNQIEKGNRIDHILIQPNKFDVLAFQTLDPRTPTGRFGSDHLPILTTLQLR